MTPNEGQKRVRKLLGEKAAWRTNTHALIGDARAIALAEAAKARAVRDEAKARKDARYRELLTDETYQQLSKEYRDSESVAHAAGAKAASRRLTVGLNLGWAFEIRGYGDNWAEVVRELDKKETR